MNEPNPETLDAANTDAGERTDDATTPTPAIAAAAEQAAEQILAGGVAASPAAAAAVSGFVKVTPAQLKSVADAAVAELLRAVKKPLKPAQAKTFQSIVERAVKFRVESRFPAQNDRARAKRERDREQIEAQLQTLKAVSAVISVKRFWDIVGKVIRTLSDFIFGAVVAV